ncbi:MAG: glycoside hydrolase family 9 protein [Fibrobacteria bacterium]|nr:glycoside hydrolase family 9 protein [Fibrobacteria bacterium]
MGMTFLLLLAALSSTAVPEPGAKPTTPSLAIGWLDGLPAGGWAYLYGGTSEGATVETTSGRKILAYRGDDRQYSGWTVHLPKSVDLSAVRSQGGLEIEFRGLVGGEKLSLGIMDDEADGPGRKTQTRIQLSDFAKVTSDWQTVVVPLSAFEDRGYWWDESRHAEIQETMDWARIGELRISSEQGANAKAAGADHRFEFQVARLRVVPVGPKIWDPVAHWKAFRSDAPDLVVWDFGTPGSGVWKGSGDPSSQIEAHLDSAQGERFLRMSYQITKWANAGASPNPGDWSHHAGMRLRVRSKRSAAMVQLALTDSSGEDWITTLPLHPGWNDLVVPFADFGRNPWYQPEGAGTDRRLDLERVGWFRLQPQENGIPGWLDIAKVELTNSVPRASESGPEPATILSNLVGWVPGSVKRFLVAGSKAPDYAILDATGKSVFTGKLSPLGRSELSGQDLTIGDFSRFDRPGRYRLAVDTLRSEVFAIDSAVYAAPFRDALRAFYFLRSGVPLAPEYAGPWARKAGHPDTALGFIEAGEGRKGLLDAHGGWYDAGDHGKYVVNGGISVATLLLLADLLPHQVPDGALGIPESGNKVSDLLDEVRFELEWMMRMQDSDGGVFFKVAGRNWPGMVMPENDLMERFAIGKTTSSTLNFAAVTAQAARLWKAIDPKFSKECLARSQKAWSWAKSHPDIAQPSEKGGSGGYGDGEFDDEFLWAATELWLATGKKSWRQEVATRLPRLGVMESADWARVQNVAMFSLALRGGKDPLAELSRQRIDSMATVLRGMIEASSLRVPQDHFRWGSNGDVANNGVVLAVDHALGGEGGNLEGLTEIVDYLLGRNPNGTSYLSGHGKPSMKNPHLRFAVADTVDAPPPGFLSGGPNSARQDDLSRNPGGVRYPRSEPARCWVDDSRSYASNEIAINWNAPVALILGYLDAHRSSSR